jgi:hypothetical protein
LATAMVGGSSGVAALVWVARRAQAQVKAIAARDTARRVGLPLISDHAIGRREGCESPVYRIFLRLIGEGFIRGFLRKTE